MFDRKKAAEFFVVAWVKDWQIQTYLEAIGAKGKPIEEITSAYPWMPSKMNYYRSAVYIRSIMSRYMRPINDALWDTKDDMAKLKFAKKISEWVSDKYIETKYDKEKRQELNKSYQAMAMTTTVNAMEIEKRRKSSGHHWNVCK